jgi:purine catabolism regulator
MDPEGVLTVRELAEEAELGLVLLTSQVSDGQPAALDMPVRGVHHSDLDDPRPYVGFEGILITHGEELAKGGDAARLYIDRLAERRTLALVVGVGEYLDCVNPAVVEHAHKMGIVVFEVPESVSYRTIVSYIHDALASTELHRLRRLLAVHEQLVRLLTEQRSIEEVVSRLSDLLGMSLALFDKTGAVVTAAGRECCDRGSLRRLWALYQEHAGDAELPGAVQGGAVTVCIFPVEVHGLVERIIVAVPDYHVVTEFEEMALAFASRLLALDLVRTREEAMRHARLRAELLLCFLSEESGSDEMEPRFRSEGIDLGIPWRVAVFAAREDSGTSSAVGLGVSRGEYELSAFVERCFRKHGTPAIAALSDGYLAAIVSVGDMQVQQAREVTADVLRRLEDETGAAHLNAGVSAPSVGAGVPARRLHQATEMARLSIDVAASDDRVIVYDDVGGRYLLFSGQSRADLLEIGERLVRPLVEYDREHSARLLETVHMWLIHRLSPHETSEALFIHRNTLGKRLRRIEELTGLDLAQMDDVVELYMAIRAAELAGLEGAPGSKGQ